MTKISQFAYKGTDLVQHGHLRDKLLDNPPQLLAVDIETISLKDRSVIGIGFGLSPIEALYVPVHSPEFLSAVLVLCDPDITKVYHNVMFDLPILLRLCPEIDCENILDTMLMCNMEGLPQELATISSHFGRNIKRIRDILPARATMDMLEDDIVADKCLDDCMATMLLYKKLWPEVNQAYFKKEMMLVPILMAMSQRGIKIDQERRQVIEEKLIQETEFYRSIAEAEGFNPASPQQVAYILMQRGNHIPIKYRNGKHSAGTNEEILKKLDDLMAALVLNYRHANKLLSTYVLPYVDRDRAYTRFHLNAATGRISSTERNMQNIPPGAGTDDAPGIRTMFLPDSGTWTDVDFNQQELRALAYISQDPEMLRIYELGLDLHQETADFIGVSRRICKNVNFAMIYGASDGTIAETAGITNLKIAHELGIRWGMKFTKAWQWIKQIQNEGIANGYVKTTQGRRLWLPSEYEESEADRRRKAVNYPIQGSAAELTKDALLACARTGYDLVLQVHDEIVVDGYIPTEELKALGLEELAPFYCPISVKHLERWE